MMRIKYGNMGGMEKTTVYLPKELKEKLRIAARKENRSAAELIRDGVEEIVERVMTTKPRPLFRSGDPDFSQRVDEYLNRFGQ